MWPLGPYAVLVAALFVRFVDPERGDVGRSRLPSAAELRPEHLAIVRRHQRVFYLVLLVAPLEWMVRGRPAMPWQLVAAAIFGLGVWGYRSWGRALGESLSPLIAPREPARLVEQGPYRIIRHPMYLAEMAMAFGAPLTLGATLTMILSVVFTMLVMHRIGVEENALQARLPAYAAYAQRTYRLVPYVY